MFDIHVGHWRLYLGYADHTELNQLIFTWQTAVVEFVTFWPYVLDMVL